MKNALMLVIAVSLILILSQKEARVNQVHPEDLTLDDLISHSTYILVVEKLAPAVRYESVAKYGGVKFKKPVKIAIYRFKVLEKLFSIYGTDKMPLVGGDKGVYAANFNTALEVQAMYEKDGTLKSPYYSYYKSGVNFEKEGKMIVFVSRTDDFKLQFVADGAYESPNKRKQIEELAKKEKSKRTGYELIDTCGEGHGKKIR